MSIDPESIEAGKCYLADARTYPQVRRVVQILPDGRVQYERRRAGPRQGAWARSVTDRKTFAAVATREVPCDWTPEKDDRHK